MNKSNDKKTASSNWESLIANKLFKYQALFDSNMLGVAATDFQDKVIGANEAFLNMIGYTHEDIKKGKLRWSVISPEKYNDTDIQKVGELLENKRIVPFEKEYVHKDGHIVPVLVGAESLDDNSNFGVCFAVDISKFTERDKKKDEFIEMVSHELRTPLSVMKFSTETLELQIQAGGKKEALLETTNELSNQIDKMKVLITDLLNMARYQATEASYTAGGIDVYETLQKLVIDLSRISGREISVRGETNVVVIGNHERLCQVFINLINNAVRYSSPYTDIVVEVRSDETKVYIDVIDKGMGIAKENTKKIFDHHYRINHADDYNEIGMGIGLYICNEIIRSHGGAIYIDSELGKGSTFTIELAKV